LQQRLDSGDLGGLFDLVDEFESRYPRVAGVKAVMKDLEHYAELDQALKAHDWVAAIKAAQNNIIRTPPFQNRVAQISAKRLPPMSIAMQYLKARELWRRGQAGEAIGQLETLAGGDWGEIVAGDLAHKREVQAGYEALTGGDRGAGYARRLLAFHATLDPVEDLYFVEVLSDDFDKYRGTLLKEAEAAFAKADKAWKAYDRSGRILGLLRLEAKISDTYRGRAARLAQAYENAHNGAKLYALLGGGPDTRQQALHDRIMKECRLQRRSLQELGMVLDPDLLQAKLELLPDPAPAAGRHETDDNQ
jgi:hypothetical protein